MRRLFWLVAGLTVGVLVYRKLQQTADRLTATSLGQSLGSALSDLAAAATAFLTDVRGAMREQEAVLREGAGLDAAGTAEPTTGPAAATPTAPAPTTGDRGA